MSDNTVMLSNTIDAKKHEYLILGYTLISKLGGLFFLLYYIVFVGNVLQGETFNKFCLP